jgi:hypothetical protein
VPTSSSVQRRRPARPPHVACNVAVRAQLELVPGYTVLILDTNILFSSLSMVTSLVESLHQTVVVPLPTIMELDGFASNATALGEATKAAIKFIATRVHLHSDALKVQTSRGNYRSSLSMRAKQVNFDDPNSWERSVCACSRMCGLVSAGMGVLPATPPMKERQGRARRTGLGGRGEDKGCCLDTDRRIAPGRLLEDRYNDGGHGCWRWNRWRVACVQVR